MDQFTKLRKHIRMIKANNFPIHNHPIQNLDKQSKDMYIKMLCFILRYTENLEEEQTMLIDRLIVGVKGDDTLQDYMQQSYYITVDVYETFVNEVLIDGLKYVFVADMLVLIHIGAHPEDVIQFAAEIIEGLGILENELSYILDVVQAILNQNIGQYFEISAVSPPKLPPNLLRYLLKSDNQVHSQITDSIISFAFTSLQALNLADYLPTINGAVIFESKQTVRFIGCTIDLSHFRMEFFDVEQIKFVGCHLKNGKHFTQFKNCNEIVVRDCIFEDYSDRIFTLGAGVGKVELYRSKFLNCEIDDSGPRELIWDLTSAGIPLRVEECTFENCGGINTSFVPNSPVISNCKTSVVNSSFVSCRQYHATNSKNTFHPFSVIFNNLFVNRNNKVINSVYLGIKEE
ncbi:MAG: hypothetical protein BEN18_05860 [Epulopiscium sp. Nuni2H_MBin001]|nr:MAG: hypothetical protein BEN18_05860 [Epulopiscium sp. Nuni2H_MBin001]